MWRMLTLAAALSALLLTVQPARAQSAAPPQGCKPGQIFYPSPARRLGLYGIVTVSFAVDKRGQVDHPEIVSSDSKYFTATVQQLLKDLRCQPPVPAPSARATLVVEFVIEPCQPLPDAPTTGQVITVCTPLMSGATATRAHGDAN